MWVLAAVLFLACEAEIVADVLRDRGHDHWPLAANVLVAAGLTVPLAWRRKPAGVAGRGRVERACSPRWPRRRRVRQPSAARAVRRAVLGRGVLAAPPALLGLAYAGLVARHERAGTFRRGRPGCSSLVAVRRRRGRSVASSGHGGNSPPSCDTRPTDSPPRAGRRELLAIAEQRTRIARELQTLIAQNVSTMIVQTQHRATAARRPPGPGRRGDGDHRGHRPSGARRHAPDPGRAPYARRAAEVAHSRASARSRHCRTLRRTAGLGRPSRRGRTGAAARQRRPRCLPPAGGGAHVTSRPRVAPIDVVLCFGVRRHRARHHLRRGPRPPRLADDHHARARRRSAREPSMSTSYADPANGWRSGSRECSKAVAA